MLAAGLLEEENAYKMEKKAINTSPSTRFVYFNRCDGCDTALLPLCHSHLVHPCIQRIESSGDPLDTFFLRI